MIDAVDELIEYRRAFGISGMLQRFYRFHQTNRQVLDFLVQELRDVRECVAVLILLRIFQRRVELFDSTKARAATSPVSG